MHFYLIVVHFIVIFCRVLVFTIYSHASIVSQSIDQLSLLTISYTCDNVEQVVDEADGPCLQEGLQFIDEVDLVVLRSALVLPQ